MITGLWEMLLGAIVVRPPLFGPIPFAGLRPEPFGPIPLAGAAIGEGRPPLAGVAFAGGCATMRVPPPIELAGGFTGLPLPVPLGLATGCEGFEPGIEG